MQLLIAYVSALLFFLAVDAVWLAFVMKGFYQAQIGHLMAAKPNLIWALIFYLVYIVGVVVFAVRPGLSGGLATAAGYGALLGLLCYATYDFTNLATLKGWPLAMSLVDTGWGTILTALTAVAGTWAARSFGSGPAG